MTSTQIRMTDMENILKNTLLTVSLISVLVVCVPGCIKENADNQAGVVGTDIVFGAASGYQNGEETRTIYSGSLSESSPSYERIDWVNSDQMTVFYNQQNGAGTYVVTGVSGTTDQVSHASVEPVSGKLVWGSGTTHQFYAMYPANGANNTLTSDGLVTGTIPGQQTITYNSEKHKYLPAMEYGYMVAYADNSNNGTISNGRVTLPFTPAMTAFEFKLRLTQDAGSNPPKLTKFELISASDPLVGTFAFNISGGNSDGATWTKTVGQGGTTLDNTGRIIEATFPSPGEEIPANDTNDYLDFTVFALPVQISGLTVRLTYADGKKRTLPLKENGSFKTFLPCKKYIITNENVPGEDWEYNLAPIEDIILYGHGTSTGNSFTVNSTRTRGGTTQPVNWGVQYSTDGTTWSDTAPTGFNISGVNTASSAANITAANSSAATSTSVTVAERTTRLQANSVESSSSAPYDLSMHTIQGGNRANGAVTANSYVVRAPGYYMFPLVYGNGIVNGTTNTQSYAPNVSGGNVLSPFLNYNNQGITSPYILTDLNNPGSLNACVVWQDVSSGSEIVLDNSVSVIDAPSNAGLTCKYIRFQIESARIKQGNVVIALRSGTTILWSWHIWVTDENLYTIPVTNASSYTSNMLNVNLGWCDTQTTTITKYPDRTFYVRVYQTVGGTAAKSTVFRVIQNGEASSTSVRYGSNVLYQWGRKDPFLGTVQGVSYNNKNWTSEYYQINGDNRADYELADDEANYSVSTTDIGTSIKNPYKMYYNRISGNMSWIGGNKLNDSVLYNLWDADATSSIANDASDSPIVKTVYDPCPPGYCLPRKSAFSGFAGNDAWLTNFNTDSARGYYVGETYKFFWDFYCNDSSNNEIINFPHSNTRRCFSSGSLYHGGVHSGSFSAYWTGGSAGAQYVDEQFKNGITAWSLQWERKKQNADWKAYQIGANTGITSHAFAIRPVREE